MIDSDPTMKEAEATIARTDHALAEANAMLERSRTEIGDVQDIARAYVDRLPAAKRAEVDREVQALADEIERDLPRRVATRQTRVKPSRQMV